MEKLENLIFKKQTNYSIKSDFKDRILIINFTIKKKNKF